MEALLNPFEPLFEMLQMLEKLFEIKVEIRKVLSYILLFHLSLQGVWLQTAHLSVWGHRDPPCIPITNNNFTNAALNAPFCPPE